MKLSGEKKNYAVWIAKVPKYLGEQILSSSKEFIVGKICAHVSSQEDSPSFRFVLSDALLRTMIPGEHTLEIKPREKKMYVVRMEDEEMAVEGIANKECFIRPVVNEQYLAYKRGVNAAKENTTRIIDYFAEIRKGEKYGSLKELDILARKRKQMLQEKKRERLDSKDVYDMIFKAYERRDLWTVKDLADFTGQPAAYIQELVAEICVLNKRDHKNSYELKPEYKNN